jgi:uncharacterized protein DUF3152
VVLLVTGLVALLGSAGVAGYWSLHRAEAGPQAGPATPTGQPTPSAPISPSPTATRPSPTAPPTWPATGPETFDYASGPGPVMGTAGTLYHFRVAVERTLPVAVDDFAAKIDSVLSDPRSWIAGGDVRLQRVAATTSANFTIYLVTPGTAYKRCLAGGFDIVVHGTPYTSCRVGAQVLINVARYLTGIPDYGAPLETYQTYAINHEVGHALGHGHELCPGKGMLAPVMQQQTLSMQGCLANAWPYVNGHRYSGPPGRI